MDTNLLIALIAAAGTVLAALVSFHSYMKGKISGQTKEQANMKERISKIELSSNVNKENFKAHEDLYTKQLEVLSEIKADVRVNKNKLIDIEKRIDREFERDVRGKY